MGTGIQWTDETWNPITGCSAVSSGCLNCFAARLAATRLKEQARYQGLATLNQSGRGVWSGQVLLHPDKLDDPLRWRKPKRIFTCDMSDLFHDDVPDEYLLRVFDTMRRCVWSGGQNCGRIGGNGHVFQILTKRPARMQSFLTRLCWDGEKLFLDGPDHSNAMKLGMGRDIWCGVSVENQQTADERIPLLLQIPAAIRFLSVEPLLESVDISEWLDGQIRFNPGPGAAYNLQPPGLSWVICGGESGPHARPCQVEWLRSVVQQCQQAGVACFVKQLGSNVRTDGVSEPGQRWPAGMERGREDQGDGTFRVFMDNPKGGSPIEWPEDLRVRQFPEGTPCE